MTPIEIRRRACLSLLVILIVLVDSFIFLFDYSQLRMAHGFDGFQLLFVQQCMIAAWLVLGVSYQVRRIVWSVIALVCLALLGMKLEQDVLHFPTLVETAALGLSLHCAALVPCVAIFLMQRKVTGMRITSRHERDAPAGWRFQIRDTLILMAACAVVALLLRSLLTYRYPLRATPSNFAAFVQLIGSAFFSGTLIGPSALLVLKPSRWNWIWAGHFLLVLGLEPLADTWLLAQSTGIPLQQFQESVESSAIEYARVMFDNLSWHALGIAPTVFGFLLIRGAGVRVVER